VKKLEEQLVTRSGQVEKLREQFAVRSAQAQKLRELLVARTAQMEKMREQLSARTAQAQKLREQLTGQAERLRELLAVRAGQIEKLREQLATRAAQMGKMREQITVKSAYYNVARKYIPIYRQGLLCDEIAKTDVDLSADCYLSLLPSTVPAAYGLSRKYGGIVVCDCVENVEVHKHSLAPNIHRPALDLVNFAAYGALLSADKLMTIGTALGRTLERFNQPLMVAPNFRRFEEPEPAGELRTACGLEPGDVLLFASGNVVIGFEPVLEALAALPAHIHLAAFVRLKPAEYEASIRARITELNLTARVHFFSFVEYERLASLAADADIGLITSDIANPNGAVGLPNRFFDYLTAGLPVIAPPMPDVVGLVDAHGCGTSLATVTAEAWCDAIKRVIAELPRYRTAAAEARKRLTWESLEDDLYEFFGRPKTLTMLGFRDISRYQRFLRIAHSFARRGTKVKAVFLSDDPAPVMVPNAEFYHFTDRYGLGPGLVKLPEADNNGISDVQS